MTFSPDWLALRLGADLTARNEALSAQLAAHFARAERLRILDIGAGTGNNMQATAQWLPHGQHWHLVDNDAALLARAEAPGGVEITTETADLALDVAALVTPDLDLVTASAFFDLCGALWLERFADALARSGAAFYTVLTYDGREEWAPPHPLDGAVLAAFHTDQRRDKGFGPSLGPDAHRHLADILRDRGYRVSEGASDWRLSSPADADLIGMLAEGSASAVRAAIGGDVESWLSGRRRADSVMIGHQDLLALPPA